jgi:uncharacterized protein (TIGR03437 family)
MGPLDSADGVFQAGQSLPTSLGGVEVRIGGTPVPLLSAQQGLITFYVPVEIPAGISASVEVRSQGVPVAQTTLFVNRTGGDFGLLTLDGAGRGLIAALNQDGTVNGPGNPAKWNSVVSVFGTGPISAAPPQPLGVGGVNNSFGLSGPVVFEYAGPAPGTISGVQQVNFRLPPNRDFPPGWLLVRPADHRLRERAANHYLRRALTGSVWPAVGCRCKHPGAGCCSRRRSPASASAAKDDAPLRSRLGRVAERSGTPG